MILRNKKTGKIFIPSDYSFASYDDGIRFDHHIYYSLAEFNEEWEDYKPIDPLIKDEKICKAIRAWAEANDLFTFKVVNEHFNRSQIIGYDAHNVYGTRIGFQSTIAHANKDQFYTIDELCGEEEE